MMKALKIILGVLFVLTVSFLTFKTVYADCSSKEECQKLIEQYEKKLVDIRAQKNTLSSQIGLMDTQITLTETRILETGYAIEKTQEQIESLGEKINGLNTSLDYLGKVLLRKIVENYKRRDIPYLNVFLDSKNAAVLANRLKYAKASEENDRHLAFEVQTAKQNYEEQKDLRERKKIELDQLKVTLDRQKADLSSQKAAKQKLLVDTGNDERTYQSLLSRAQAQAAAFKSFVSTSGAGSIIGANAFGGGSDGAYFSQRDSRWASNKIGNSSEDILSVGCLLSSVAMALKKKGVDTSPAAIAANSNYFYANTAYMNYRWSMNPWPNGLNSYSISTSQIDSELNNGNSVIVGVNGCSHFVLLTKKEGDEYKMHDPLYGPDINFSSHYSGFCSAETFK